MFWSSAKIDSKDVNPEIRRIIWPQLKANGFSKFASRNAWRYGSDSIDVINLQSFNSYNASVLGVTTFSFSVNLACYLKYVPPQWPVKEKDGQLIPAEYDGQFRRHLQSSIPQAGDYKHKQGIWALDKKGRNLAVSMEDVAQQIPSALAWFARLTDKEEVLCILLEDDVDMNELWGFGRNPSPVRSYLAGYVALSLGQEKLALAKLGEAVQSKCFDAQFSTVEQALDRAVNVGA